MAPTLRRAVIVDIDGTLAIRSGDRSPFDWSRVGEDTPNPAVVELVRILDDPFHIILMSGRDESCRLQTEMWLDAQLVPFDELYMRPANDNRKDSLLKAELYRTHILNRYEVAFVIDDRTQVVRMWRDVLGLTVFQVADGDF